METIWTQSEAREDVGNVYLGIGYRYLDEPEPRMPADTSTVAVVRDYQGYGRDVEFYCDRLSTAASASIRRSGIPTWHAEGVEGPLYLTTDVQDALGGDFGE